MVGSLYIGHRLGTRKPSETQYNKKGEPIPWVNRPKFSELPFGTQDLTFPAFKGTTMMLTASSK